MEERTQFNNGQGSDSRKIQKEEMSLAISEWAEGDEDLKSAIETCLENSIPTMASCAGHNLMDSPYLVMIITPENLERILNIMNRLTIMNGVETSLSFQRLTGMNEEYSSTLAIHTNMLNKKQCFNSIAEAAKTPIKLEETSEVVQVLWDTHKTLRTHQNYGDRFCNRILYKNGILSKMLMIQSYANSIELDFVIAQAKMRKQKNMFNQVVYTKRALVDSTVINKLKNVKAGAERYPACKEDEFYSKSSKDIFIEEMKKCDDLENTGNEQGNVAEKTEQTKGNDSKLLTGDAR